MHLRYLLLPAGTYTVEATTHYAQAVGSYSVSVSRWPADACVRDLGTLDATTSSATGSGIVAVDASCTSSQRDPGSASTYYARRHTFTLGVDSSVSFGHSGSRMTALLIEGSSSDGTGTVLGRSSGAHLVLDTGSHTLDAGTYTIEATTDSPGHVGSYSVWVERFDLDACVRDLGTLDATTTTASGSGIVAQDASCTSSQRDSIASSTHYARRHTFTLGAAATVSVGARRASPGSLRTYVVLTDASGAVVGRAAGDSRHGSSRLDHLLLQAGIYTIEATSYYSGATGGYSVSVTAVPVRDCVVELGELGDGLVSRAGLVKSDGCESVSRHGVLGGDETFLSNYLRFSLAEEKIISIDLLSGDNTFLYLLDGHGARPTYRRDDDDSGYGTNSRLFGRLAAGSYTIEATTSAVPAELPEDRATVDVYIKTSVLTALGTTYGNACPLPDGN